MLKQHTTEIHTSTRPRNLAPRLWGYLLTAGLLGTFLSQAGGETPTPDRISDSVAPTVEERAADRHEAVLALSPVGYWPADKGAGDELHDLSPTKNHGRINHVPWDGEKDLLHFTGSYQWIEIPQHEVYQTPTFSMGGWVFLRSDVIGSGWVNRQGLLFFGNRDWLTRTGVQLCIRKQEVIDVVSDGREDVLGTRLYASHKDGERVERAYGEPSLAIGQWHHLLYTFKPGEKLSSAPLSPNLALAASVSASNDGGHPSRAPQNVNDGKVDTSWIFWLGAGSHDNQMWIRLDFGKEVAINRIRLVNPEGATTWFEEGRLHFSDGSFIDVPRFNKSFFVWDAMFADKKVEWIKYEAVGTTQWQRRPGLGEFEVYKEDFSVSPEEGVVTNLAGTGKLYLNGQLIRSSQKIEYRSAAANLQVGNDAMWWHQMMFKSGSLDGAVRDMVWFDRAISAEEAARLSEVTKPSVKPEVYDDTMIVLDGRGIAVHDLASLPPATRRTALLLFGRKDVANLQPLGDALLSMLSAALAEPSCRLEAAQLLLKLDNDAAHAVLRNALPQLIAVVQDLENSQQVRADAALALAAMGETAAEAVPALADTLDQLIAPDNIPPPRVDELLRNALTRALLDIDSEHAQARKVLGRTFAAPLLNMVDLDNPEMVGAARADELRTLIEAGQSLDAMRLYAQLPASARERFFTYKAPWDRDYTGTARFNGATYKVGTGIAWQGVEKVPENEYLAIVAKLAEDYPAAKDWRASDYEHLYRVPITKIDADGQEQRIYLEGKNFILDGQDEKLRGWSVFIDELGYVHLTGGQHNAPNPDNFIPGSWEKMGVSRDLQSDDFPLQMYWVSSEPESVDSFEFAGRRRDPRAIPAGYLNYMVFEQSPSNETYLYGRADAFGWQTWGMFRYSAAAKRWEPIGGDVYELIESARRHNPAWLDYLHDPIRGTVPKEPSAPRPLVWAWQPPFYNFCRDEWGVRFDKTGRMHVRMQISGLDGAGYVRPTSVYAWSDDGGRSFHRADGSEVKLPLTVNSAPEHNAEIATDNTLQHHDGDQFVTRQWWELWLGLLRHAGYGI